jgi:hypothetical protein
MKGITANCNSGTGDCGISNGNGLAFSTSPGINLTSIVNEPSALLPAESDAVHTTFTLPIGNREPELGEHSGLISPSTVSIATML